MGNKDFHSRVLALLASLAISACAAHTAEDGRSSHSPMGQGSMDSQASAPGVDKMTATLPEPPATIPSPWIPLAVEEAMGARCVTSEQRTSHGQYQLLIDDYCIGPAPAHLARVLLALPGSELHLAREQLESLLRQPLPYVATPGLGKRPDFLLGVGPLWIRSFEAPDSQETVYLVLPSRCDAQTTRGCEQLDGGLIYHLDNQGKARNITSQVLSSKPVLTLADRSHYLEHGGIGIVLDTSKLRYVPTLRWFMEFDPDTPIADSDPRRYGNFAHFGFLIWNGLRFEARQRVARPAWPCRPAIGTHPECSRDPEPDPFVK